MWPLAGLTVIIGTSFRPVAFGYPMSTLDNASAIPIIAICVLLTATRIRWIHGVLVPLVLASVLLDVLTFSHSIG